MSLIPFGFGSRTTDPFSSPFDLWDPFASFNWPAPAASLFNTPSTALSFPGRSAVSSDIAQFASTRIDWRETPEAHVFKADLPGIRKEEVRVEVEEGNVLQISGERSKDVEETTDTWHRVERGSGRFLRRFRLPDNARMDQVKATMENGVLTVTVPKLQAAKRPEVKAIDISG